MKKITTILSILIASVGMMNGQNYSDLTAGTATTHQSTTSSVIVGQLRTTTVTPYDSRSDFEAAYTGAMVNEDFSGGPGAGQIVPCGSMISSAGDGCFASGVLEAGFQVTANSGGDVIYIGAGAIGNTSTLVGANTFADSTVLSFSPQSAYAVGFDLFVSGQPGGTITVYDSSGTVMETYTVNNTPDTENFFGVVSDVAIGSIEIKGDADSGELLGNLSFGLEALSIRDNRLAGFNFYPNPTNDVLNLSASKNIEKVSLFNLIGQKVMSIKIGLTSSNINLGSLAPGTYIMEVTVDGKTGTYKVTKK